MKKQILLLKVDTNGMDAVTGGIEQANFIKKEMERQLSTDVLNSLEIVAIPSFNGDSTNITQFTTVDIYSDKRFDYSKATKTIENL